MKFIHLSDLSQAFPPGSRCWVAGLRLGHGCRKIVKRMAPTYVEACAGRYPEHESRLRGRKPLAITDAIVPVLPDGSLDWKRATGTGDLHYCQTQAEAEQCFANDVAAAKAAIRGEIADLEAMLEKLNKI